MSETRGPKPWDTYRMERWERPEDEKEAPSAEDARKYFERELLRLCDYSGEKKHPEKIGAYRAALDCIYKQIPEKPHWESLADFNCAECGAYINYDALNERIEHAPRYCSHCGQRIDWGDKEDRT